MSVFTWFKCVACYHSYLPQTFPDILAHYEPKSSLFLGSICKQRQEWEGRGLVRKCWNSSWFLSSPKNRLFPGFPGTMEERESRAWQPMEVAWPPFCKARPAHPEEQNLSGMVHGKDQSFGIDLLTSMGIHTPFCPAFHETLDLVLKLVVGRNKPTIKNASDCPETQSLEANK